MPTSSSPRSPSRSSRGTIVFTVIAVVTLGSTLATAGLGGGAEGRLGAARARMNAECKELGGDSSRLPSPGNPCDLRAAGAPVVPELKLQEKELAAADAALRAGDRPGAVARLAHVLERADGIDRRNTLIASLVAGKLIEAVAARVDADPSLLDDPRLASAVRRTAYASSRHPLASERLHALAVLANVPAQLPLRSAGFVEAKATEAMTDADGTLRQMEAALLAKDVALCEKTSQRATGLAAQVTIGGGICPIAVRVVESGERLERLRARAVARGGQGHATAARRY